MIASVKMADTPSPPSARPPYTLPDDAPVGDLLRVTGRHPWRPSQLHFIIEADGYRALVTELFPDNVPIWTKMPCSACAAI